ncbi:hypothetical protein D9M73_62560 [compost metagenome]
MREQLIQAMALRVGQPITQDTAVAILADLFPDRYWPVDVFGVQEFEGYTFQCERMLDILVELDLMHAVHYEETEKYRAGIPMAPDYDAMLEDERAGSMIQFTARAKETGELAGNMRVYIRPSRHTKTLTCKEDTFFVSPAHRGGMMAVRLWQFVERAVVDIVGVKEIRFDSKTVNKADRMALYLKYEPAGTQFVKMFL